VKRRRLRLPRLGRRTLFRFGRGPVFGFGRGPLFRAGGRLGRSLLRSPILRVFLGLCILGFIVGAQTRPATGTFPYAELFDQLQVVSYRDAPTDTSSRFVVQLCAGGRVFSQYDIETRSFQAPPSGRSYSRTITGTHYVPLRVRGHVGYGFWLDVPSRRALLPEQFDELYQRTLSFVKPVSQITGVLGILSGYSVGYRLGARNGSLSSRAVQQRVLATPNLGRMIAREAWRRVLLEPAVMTGEEEATRFAAVTSTHRLYANFFRVALDDSNGFVPREAARLEQLGHVQDARAMLAFARAARRAAQDSIHMANADFEAVERWATLLDQRGHWVHGATPPPGEERIKLMGTLAWYGLAPPGQNVDRVWVGPRMLVRVGDTEGFVADEIPGTEAGCPISWRGRLGEANSGASAMVGAWLADRPEFTALAVLGRRIAHRLGSTYQHLADLRSRPQIAPDERPRIAGGGVEAAFAHRTPTILSEVTERGRGDTYAFQFPSMGGGASIRLVAADSAQATALARAAQAVVERVEPSWGGAGATEVGEAPRAGNDIDSTTVTPWTPHGALADRARMAASYAVDEAGDTLLARGVRDALIELPGTALALGTSTAGEPWSPALRDPRGRIPSIARLRLAPGQALATSARRERSQGLIGVAVVAADARTAARWTATLLDLDIGEARAQARQHPEIAAVLIEGMNEGREVIWVEADLEDRFVLGAQAQTLFRVESF
jgi:ApbE family protein